MLKIPGLEASVQWLEEPPKVSRTTGILTFALILEIGGLLGLYNRGLRPGEETSILDEMYGIGGIAASLLLVLFALVEESVCRAIPLWFGRKLWNTSGIVLFIIPLTSILFALGHSRGFIQHLGFSVVMCLIFLTSGGMQGKFATPLALVTLVHALGNIGLMFMRAHLQT